MKTYYQPSGKFSYLSLPIFILASFTALPLFAFIYAYVVFYNPFVYIGFFATAIFGAGIGYFVNWSIVRWGKIRSSLVAITFGLLASLVTLYFHWVFWINIVYYNTEVMELVLSPTLLYDLILNTNAKGVWSFESDTPVTGIMLYIFWIIELLMIIGFALFFSTAQSKAPFCEQTNQWLEEEELPAFPFIEKEDKDFIVKSLENGNETIFDELQSFQGSEYESHSTFILYSPKGNGESYLSIDNKHLNYDDKGKPQFRKKSVIKYISISETLKSKLRGEQNATFAFNG